MNFMFSSLTGSLSFAGSCLGMVVEGPWEPVYTIVKARMSPIRSMGQIADLAGDIQQKKLLKRRPVK